MAVAEPEIEPAAAEGAEGRQPWTVADHVQRVAERREDPKKKRNRSDLLTMAAIVYHFENMSQNKVGACWELQRVLLFFFGGGANFFWGVIGTPPF